MFKELSKAFIGLLNAILVVICLSGCSLDSVKEALKEVSSENSSFESIELEEVTLKRVVDGDTIIVVKSNQEDIRVRMIGVDTPESVHPDETKNTDEGDLASAYTKSQLKVGQTLYLEYDMERLDQYGRTLAYVWLDDDVDFTNLNDIQTKMYNAKLVVEGYAVAKKFPPNIKYATVFESLEK